MCAWGNYDTARKRNRRGKVISLSIHIRRLPSNNSFRNIVDKRHFLVYNYLCNQVITEREENDMVEIKWNRDKVEVYVDYYLKYSIDSKGFFSHRVNRLIKGTTIATVISASPEFRNICNQPALFRSVYEMCQRDIGLGEKWEYFEKIQKACPEVRFIPSYDGMELFGRLKTSERKDFYSFLRTNYTNGLVDLHQVILYYNKKKAYEQVFEKYGVTQEKFDTITNFFSTSVWDNYPKYKNFLNDFVLYANQMFQINWRFNPVKSTMFNFLREMYQWAVSYEVELSWKYGEDIVLAYAKMEQTVLMIKDRANNAKLERYAAEMKAKLYFCDENFEVIIPKCVEDFRKESEQQNNCVLRCYLEPTVNRKTNIVFIRFKHCKDKSLITCEVNAIGNIKQYLKKNNARPCERVLIEFREKYQAFLNNSFKE